MGAGISKHCANRACIYNNRGADFCVYINTAIEYDGSDSGALPAEAITCGKVSPDAKYVKI